MSDTKGSINPTNKSVWGWTESEIIYWDSVEKIGGSVDDLPPTGSINPT